MKNKKTNYITIYADDFDVDIWENYCHAANVPLDATYITIYFNDEDVESDATSDPDEEDDDNYPGDYIVLIKHPTDETYDEYEVYMEYKDARARFEQLKDALITKDINNGIYVSYAKVHEVVFYNEATEEEYDSINL